MDRMTAQIFEEMYGEQPDVTCFAPGRVNLIGEHTDYNGGYVFPCAIDMGIECSAKRRGDRTLRLYSEKFADKGVLEYLLDDFDRDGSWADYVRGVAVAFIRYGYTIPCGADLVFNGDLPHGAGLSSSAALEVLTGAVLRALYEIPATQQELALIGQFAENRFVGLSCGLMDQFASAMGRQGHAILLNTDDLDCSYAPLPADKAAVVLVDSFVKHSLTSSAYGDRRRECERALSDIQQVRKTASLCALTPDEFEACKDAIQDDTCRRRARHAVYENRRTLDAAAALREGDIARFGELMRESHLSLRDDYEVSCRELDLLAEAAWATKGVYGARMTGGGFGGCTVNLVEPQYLNLFVKRMSEFYEDMWDKTARIYVVTPGDGVKTVR